MPFTVEFQGALHDVRYARVKRMSGTVYKVFLAEVCIAQVFKMRNTWSVVVIGEDLCSLRKVDGLRTRYHCVAYALRALGVWPD